MEILDFFLLHVAYYIAITLNLINLAVSKVLTVLFLNQKYSKLDLIETILNKKLKWIIYDLLFLDCSTHPKTPVYPRYYRQVSGEIPQWPLHGISLSLRRRRVVISLRATSSGPKRRSLRSFRKNWKQRSCVSCSQIYSPNERLYHRTSYEKQTLDYLCRIAT